jgi:hypothetical protein
MKNKGNHMIKIILILLGLNTLIYAGFMDSVADVVKATLSDDEVEIPEIQTVGTVETTLSSQSKQGDSSLLDDVVESIEKTIRTKKETKDESILDTSIDVVSDTIGLEAGESWGMPSIFGFNKKKEHKVLGSEFLGDIKDTGSTFYKGFKNTGESAEFMSGMMYKSSKVYNDMFHLFDDSPFNVFEEEDESSIFDVFEKGNDVLDIID